jgi:hypothetical protein
MFYLERVFRWNNAEVVRLKNPRFGTRENVGLP